MQDPNPLPWGALDRYQAHYMVLKDVRENYLDYTAKTMLKTKGNFEGKKIIGVTWEGGYIARKLNADSKLTEMILHQSVEDATIFVEPTEGAVRIRNKWKNHLEFGVSSELFEIYDRIAGHIKES